MNGYKNQAHVIIPNAIDDQFLSAKQYDREKVREDFGLSNDAFVWLAVGRLEPQKDYFSLLSAYRKVLSVTPNSILMIIGEGSLRSALESRSEILGLNGKVRFLGHRSDIQAVLSWVDGFVLSSAWEGLPNVVMEAMAVGVPVVATNVGGVAELVQDGETGYLVPPGDPARLAEAMLRMMGLPRDRMTSMATIAAGRMESFDVRRITDLWLALIDDVCRKKRLRCDVT